MAADAAAKTTNMAEDTLKAKSRDGSVISGGGLAAKAFKAKGVDVRHERVAALALQGA